MLLKTLRFSEFSGRGSHRGYLTFRNEEYHSFESQAEATVRRRPEFSCFEVPPELFFRKLQLFNPGKKLIIISPLLGSTDYLADAGERTSMALTVLLSSFCFI